MTENSREWIGITVNECTFQGVVTGDPTVVDGNNGKCAFINLRTTVSELAANGQWVETTVHIPLIVMDTRKVEKVILPYVKDKRQLYVKAYYKVWKDEHGNPRHGMVVTKLQLGSKGTYSNSNGEAKAGLPK